MATRSGSGARRRAFRADAVAAGRRGGRGLLAAGAALVLLALAAVAYATPEPAPMAVQLIDQAPQFDGGARIIDAVWQRILPPGRGEVVVPLRTWPAQPRLHVSLGIAAPKPPQTPPTARFTIWLRRPGAEPRELLTRELSRPGWVDVQVDLAGVELADAALVFRKTLLSGDPKQIGFAVWANPMLLPAEPRPAPSVVLVSLDTLRADRLGISGYANARSPTLDALAREHTWYANSYSASGWTYPSHAALFYGRYPATVPPVRLAARHPSTRGQPRPKPVPELFRDAGYLTAAFTGGGYLSNNWGFPTGFNTFFIFPQPPFAPDACSEERFDGAVVFGKARQWLKEYGRNPFFLLVHTYDVHDRCPVWPKNVGPYEQWPDPGPEARKRIAAYYDELVGRVDALVAGLLDDLKTQGLLDRTVVLITSDHGEAFWEHGVYGHGCGMKLYDPLLRVPLIVRAPGRPPQGRVDQPVSAVDVAPTLLALAGLPRPEGMDGRPLPQLGFDSRPADAPVFAQCNDELAVRVGRHKLLTSRAPEGTTLLFDLQADPGEKANLLPNEKATAASLQRHAADYWRRAPAPAAAAKAGKPAVKELDEGTKERLRALGYIE